MDEETKAVLEAAERLAAAYGRRSIQGHFAVDMAMKDVVRAVNERNWALARGREERDRLEAERLGIDPGIYQQKLETPREAGIDPEERGACGLVL